MTPFFLLLIRNQKKKTIHTDRSVVCHTHTFLPVNDSGGLQKRKNDKKKTENDWPILLAYTYCTATTNTNKSAQRGAGVMPWPPCIVLLTACRPYYIDCIGPS